MVLAGILAVGPPVAVPAAAAAASIVMYIDGVPNDGLTDGAQRVSSLGGLAISDGPTTFAVFSAGGPDDTWQLEIHAPAGETFQAGATYPGTDGALILSNSALGSCGIGQDGSWFKVHALGAPFAVTFAVRCDGPTDFIYGYFGTYDSTTPVAALLQPEEEIELPNTAIGQTSAPIEVQFQSAGTAAANVTSVDMAGPSAGNFTIVDETCTDAPIAVGNTCTVDVSFTPSLSGELRGRLVLEDDTLRGQRSVTIVSIGTAQGSAVNWGSRETVGANYTWSYGSHLARTTSATKAYLHDVATTPRVGGSWADDNGPYLGVMYVRGNASGTSWGTPIRVNASSQHGDAATIATSGKFVYVTWYRITKYIHFNPAGPRTLYFRRNSSHGASGSWGARLALTSTSGRVGSPTIAASGASVYVAYTDADTGAVRLAKSSDRGATWTKSTIGSTTAMTSNGYEGAPSLAASGSNVVVSWLADGDLRVVARVSTTGGSSWGSQTVLATSSTSVPASAARDSRVGVTWMAEDGARFSLWTAGAWGVVRKVGAPYGSGRTYVYHYQPALAFGAAGQVGIAWTACWYDCDTFVQSTRADLVWAESKDAGVTWYRAQMVGGADGLRWRVNDAPSIVWATAGKRIIGWNSYQAAGPYYRMFLRSGSGTN